jgi:5-methyltetrahydrofolate--homocysteine methyltransferase
VTKEHARRAYIGQHQGRERAAARAASQQEREGAAAVADAGARQEIQIDWARYAPPAPEASWACASFDDYPLDELVPYIDWMPFFNAWEFAGKFPDILEDPWSAPRRAICTRMRRACSDSWSREMAARARGRRLLSRPTSSATMTSRVLRRDARRVELRLHQLRQQKPSRRIRRSCASPISSRRVRQGRRLHRRVRGHRRHRHRGARRALRGRARRLQQHHAQGAGGSLAEALAERMHERVRRELWGYAPMSGSTARR